MITLKTLPQATAQEVFDQVVRHLLTQKEKSMTEVMRGDGHSESVCAYRGANGTKCAAGCLIADDEYRPWLEERGWLGMAGDGSVPREHGDLIDDLQRVHDSFSPDDWAEALRVLAQRSGMSAAVIDEFASA